MKRFATLQGIFVSAVLAVLVVDGALSSEAEACSLHSSAPAMSDSGETGDDEEGDEEASSVGESDDAQGLSGRVQLGAQTGELRFGTDETGRASLRESTMMLQGELWVSPSFGVSASAPLTRRSLELPSGAQEQLQGIGDMGVELAWRTAPGAGLLASGSGSDETSSDTATTSRLAVEFRVGALLPTAPMVRHDDGSWYHPDVQPGVGVVVPRAAAGVSLGLSSSVRLFVGADGLWAPESPDGVQRGATGRLYPTVHWQAIDDWSLSLSAPLRYEAKTSTQGDREVTTGGWLWRIDPQVRWTPLDAWSLEAGPRIPVIQALRGGQRESVGVQVSTTWRM